MATATFAISLDVDAAAEGVHGLLSDLHALRVLHPLIEEIRDLAPEAEQPEARRYRVVDRIPMGPVRLRVAYVATLWVVSSSEIRATAEQFPGIRLETTYRLIESPGSTQLNETVRLTAPRPLCGWVARQAEAAHRTMLERLRAHLERPSCLQAARADGR